MAQRLAVVFIAISLSAAPAAAQDHTTTLRDIVTAMSTASTRAHLAESMPDIAQELSDYLVTLNQSGLLDMTAEQLAAAVASPRISALARTKSGLAPAKVADALSGIKGLRNNEVLQALGGATSPDEADRILQPVTDFQSEQLTLSIRSSEDILRKYERKFGPDSARLNGAEVLLNYVLQRSPGFGPDQEGSPGALEAIASYSPTYMTYAAGHASMVSVGEFGLRLYFFGDRWGQDGLKGLLRPSFMTLGLAVAAGQDGALKWPWQGHARLGAFVSWGALKIAYVDGGNKRLMISRQFQLVPFVF